MGQVPAWGPLLLCIVLLMPSICNNRAKQGGQKENSEFCGDVLAIIKRTVGISLHYVYAFSYSEES